MAFYFHFGDEYGPIGERGSQKKFYWTSHLNEMIGNTILDDIRVLDGRSAGETFESLLFKAYLPKSDPAWLYAVPLYADVQAKKPLHSTVRTTLASIFRSESARNPHSNVLPIVSYARDLLVRERTQIKRDLYDDDCENPSLLTLLTSEWEAIVRKLEAIAQRKPDDLDAKLTAEYARQTLTVLTDGRMYYLLFNAFTLVIDEWEELGKDKRTFGFLAAAMEAADDWTDTPQDRRDFVRLCDSVMESWTKESMLFGEVR